VSDLGGRASHFWFHAREYQIGLECATVACPLAWASLTWMTAEGAIAAIAGLIANSIALIGFGIDSAIEGLASLIIIWRFSGSRRLSEQAERRAQKLVAISFFLLAPYIAVEAIRNLVTASKPGTSWLGIGLTIASAISMPFLGIAKKRLGTRLHSAATVGEGTQNLIGARPINPPREAELEAGDRYARLSWPRR
jgi:divalent metal cation (Fe/Co/Zn/Cd) transporter